eukprot:7387691-Prymnesium_polylepis.3
MSANDAHPGVFAEFTCAWPLRPSKMSGHSPLPEALSAQGLHRKQFDASWRSKPTLVGSDQS